MVRQTAFVCVGLFLVSGCGVEDGGDIAPSGFGSRPPSTAGLMHNASGSELLATAPVSASPAPPPISGGTLTVSANGQIAVAADPDRDQVYIVDLALRRLTHTVPVGAGSEPGRVALSADTAFVALRRSGEVVGITLQTGDVAFRKAVCAAPRGIAFDASRNELHVACDTGELVTFEPHVPLAPRIVNLGRDLRDVIVDGSRLLITRFRSSELLVVEQGLVTSTIRPWRVRNSGFDAMGHSETRVFEPTVAMRALPIGAGNVAILHQHSASTPVKLDAPEGADEFRVESSSSYGSVFNPCGGIVNTVVSVVAPDARSASLELSVPALPAPVDMAVSGPRTAIVAPGLSTVVISEIPTAPTPSDPDTDAPHDTDCNVGFRQDVPVAGEPIAVAFSSDRQLLVQTRQPARLLWEDGGTLLLSDVSRADTGLAFFYAPMSAGIACASCHPEGRDDGHTWNFDPIGHRRTQVPAGGILATAPFHWDGDMTTLSTLVTEVMGRRMGGPELAPEQEAAFASWLNSVPAPAASVVKDPEAVARGKALFMSSETQCAGCHDGPMLTNNEAVDVGTGGVFQVPALRGIAARAPFMHNGCAPSLADRFGACGGGDKHGVTSHLTQSQVSDLVSYLETL